MFRSVPRSAGWICLEAMLPPSQPPAIQRVDRSGHYRTLALYGRGSDVAWQSRTIANLLWTAVVGARGLVDGNAAMWSAENPAL